MGHGLHCVPCLMADWYSVVWTRIALPASVCRLDGSVVCMHAFTCIISITVGATKKLAVCLISLRVAGTCHLSLYPEATFPRIFCARNACIRISAGDRQRRRIVRSISFMIIDMYTHNDIYCFLAAVLTPENLPDYGYIQMDGLMECSWHQSWFIKRSFI